MPKADGPSDEKAHWWPDVVHCWHCSGPGSGHPPLPWLLFDLRMESHTPCSTPFGCSVTRERGGEQHAVCPGPRARGKIGVCQDPPGAPKLCLFGQNALPGTKTKVKGCHFEPSALPAWPPLLSFRHFGRVQGMGMKVATRPDTPLEARRFSF